MLLNSGSKEAVRTHKKEAVVKVMKLILKFNLAKK